MHAPGAAAPRAGRAARTSRPARSRLRCPAPTAMTDRHRELHDAGAEVAAGCVEPERPALLRLGEEERDVRHRRGEVAAAEAGEGGARRAGRRTRCRAAHTPRRARRRDAAAAARRRWSSCGRRRSAPRTCRGCRSVAPTRLGRAMSQNCWSERQAEPGCRQLRHDDAPQRPDAEAEELGEDRQPPGCGGRWPCRRRARRPWSSGSQWSIQRPDRCTGRRGRAMAPCAGASSEEGDSRVGADMRAPSRTGLRGRDPRSVAMSCFRARRPPLNVRNAHRTATGHRL